MFFVALEQSGNMREEEDADYVCVGIYRFASS